MKKYMLPFVGCLFCIVLHNAKASTLNQTVDFFGLTPGVNSTPLTIGDVTFTAPSAFLIFVTAPDVGRALCPFNPAEFSCGNDFTVSYANPIDGFGVTVREPAFQDGFSISFFDSDTNLLGQLEPIGSGPVEFFATGISEVFFEIEDVTTGASFTDFRSKITPVPLPAAFWMFGAGFAAIFVSFWRK